jgi:hypothetical protein
MAAVVIFPAKRAGVGRGAHVSATCFDCFQPGAAMHFSNHMEILIKI